MCEGNLLPGTEVSEMLGLAMREEWSGRREGRSFRHMVRLGQLRLAGFHFDKEHTHVFG